MPHITTAAELKARTLLALATTYDSHQALRTACRELKVPQPEEGYLLQLYNKTMTALDLINADEFADVPDWRILPLHEKQTLRKIRLLRFFEEQVQSITDLLQRAPHSAHSVT